MNGVRDVAVTPMAVGADGNQWTVGINEGLQTGVTGVQFDIKL
jgi:hypothetical protein